MSRLVKIVNNKYVQIEEYKNPNICFNTNEYDNFEDYCTLRETFDPFEIFYENQELKSQLKGTTHCFDEEEHEKLKKQLEENKDKINWYENFEINKTIDKLRIKHNNQQKEFINYLEDEIKFHKNRDSYMVADILGSYDLNDIELKLLEEILQKYKSIIGSDK